eukprot:2444591-Prymnesium_polylepis.1
MPHTSAACSPALAGFPGILVHCSAIRASLPRAHPLSLALARRTYLRQRQMIRAQPLCLSSDSPVFAWNSKA